MVVIHAWRFSGVLPSVVVRLCVAYSEISFCVNSSHLRDVVVGRENKSATNAKHGRAVAQSIRVVVVVSAFEQPLLSQ
jgi:hypothetical protein